ncbi:calcium channel protein [Lunasporangiospora selenospora]|uniref:Calcium channel protein n=1 Tax=Lunasporangiospora selenospora TaxID=979761 RepID=A0A9P6KIV9_9FUNG|nr:calcium channel protein [Lunasporangiospora selenospora]
MVSSPNGTDNVWGTLWVDYGLLVIFILYTIEIGARVIVSGLIFYPNDGDKIRKFFGKKQRTDNLHDTNPTILRKMPHIQKKETMLAPSPTIRPMGQASPMSAATKGRAATIIDFAIGRQTTVTQFIPTYMDPLIAYKPQFIDAGPQIPFLRHTFNRIDMLAVVCYWIDFALMMAGVREIYVFKAIAAMRTLRLLNITSGSSTILHSLKKSAPLLVNIALFIVFFFILFSIIGVQAFKGSFSRRCVPRLDTPGKYLNETNIQEQFCGGHYDFNDTSLKKSYIMRDGSDSPTSPKGYICAVDYVCKDIGVNYNYAVSFDNIFSAMVPVYVLMTGQTWTDLMYKVMDSEYPWSSIYFVLVVLVMNFWILNLFIAVINEMFAKIRDDSSNNSAFSSDKNENKNILNESVSHYTYAEDNKFQKQKLWIERLEFFWVVAVVVDLVFQCLPQYTTPPERLAQLGQIELVFTIAFVFDVLIRFLIYMPDTKEFFRSRKNCVDLFLALVTMIIQIPAIRSQRIYIYLSVFQVLRIYRPIIYVERLQTLIRRVVGGWVGLLNLIFFIALFLGVVSVMAGILFREIVKEDESMDFSDFYVSYLGMYQAINGRFPGRQVVVSTLFTFAFYCFANFVLVNMLIAIIMENFEGGAEAAKHAQQIVDYALAAGKPKDEERKFINYLRMYLKPYPKSIGIDIIHSGWVHRMRKGLARHFLLGDKELFHGTDQDPLLRDNKDPKKHMRRASNQSDLSLSTNYTPLSRGDDYDGNFRSFVAARDDPSQDDGNPLKETKKRSCSSFIPRSLRRRALSIFGPDNKLRRLFQRFVTPGGGRRRDGEQENVMLSRPFNVMVTFAILACVIVAVITTPVWRFEQSRMPSYKRSVIITTSDYVFPFFFTIEFFIRVIADGFIFTPDAYLNTFWNKIDFFVLLTLYAPLVANLTNSQGVSRFFRSLKALRALRLINQSAYIKGTFHAVLVAGFPQLFDAMLLCMTLIVPFAIYGMRLFSGFFFSCNDSDNTIQSVNHCVGIFEDPETSLWKPRVWSNPDVYSFNNFGASFLILFEIVSQEGWTGVMKTARDIVGLGLQPAQDASRYNGIFFVLFNLAGGFFVSALFVAIVIENYTKRTGTAFMTADQRRWMDLKKLLGGITMSKVRSIPPEDPIRRFFYTIVSPKKGWFTHLLTFVTVLNGILLATEHVNSGDLEMIKNWVSLVLLSVYMIEIVLKVGGLGWLGFRKNRWNLYNSIVSTCAFFITILRVGGNSWQWLIQLQKLLQTAILFRLVPRIDSLNQLFMTMAEGWNDLMHDFAVEKPNCVNQPYDYLLSDCGSTAWAYTLFISFNIISMYIFTNMFIVVVMHNFSYVYQIAPGFSLITREEIRGYKRAWAEVDKERTGYIQERDLTKFLMKLRGVFDLRIYNEEHTLQKLQSRLETVRPNAVKLSARELEKNTSGPNQARKVLMLNETNRRSTFIDLGPNKSDGKQKVPDYQKLDLSSKLHQDYNLAAFNSAIANMDHEQIQRRRRVYTFLYTEVVMSMEPIPGSEDRGKKGLLRWTSMGLSGGKSGAKSGGNGGNGGNGGIWSNRNSRDLNRKLDGDFEMGEIGGESQPDVGISFQKMLNILAHYKLIEDDQCLSIGDLLRHRQKMDRIHAQVNVTNVKGILLRVMLRRRFLKHYSAVNKILYRTHDSSDDDFGQDGAGSSASGSSSSKRHDLDKSQDPTAAPGTGRQRVQINVESPHEEEDHYDTDSAAAGVGTKAVQRSKKSGVKFEDDDKPPRRDRIDSNSASNMIEDLRDEWRLFISAHDLSTSVSGHDFKMELEDVQETSPSFTQVPPSEQFENIDLHSPAPRSKGSSGSKSGRR